MNKSLGVEYNDVYIQQHLDGKGGGVIDEKYGKKCVFYTRAIPR